MVYALGLEAIRQAALERLGMAGSHKLVLGGTTLLLRALRGQQVTKTGRAANQLSRSGNFEALGDGLFGLLHGESGRKQRVRRPMARGNFAKLIYAERPQKPEGQVATFPDRLQIGRNKNIRNPKRPLTTLVAF